MKIDFLIIGQGLAGSLLAWELIQRGCRVLVVDDGKENASHVAAGLVNPVTGMRLVKAVEVDSCLSVAKLQYAGLGRFFRQDFYVEKPMLRVLHDHDELMQAQKRQADADYQAYLDGISVPEPALNGLIAPYGLLLQKQTGHLSTRPLLSRLKAFFIAKNCYRTANIAHETIELTPFLRWQDIVPKKIIFCEGHQVSENPWFSWLPFQPAKGEILTLTHHSELPDKFLNYGNWMIPTSDNQIRIGATFDNCNLDTTPTEAARLELLAAFNAIWTQPVPVTLNRQEAHIRPCTLDKHPFVGFHPKYPQLAIFNGFGSKGSLQIPWYSQRFADSLLIGAPPPANIKRYAASIPG